MHNKVRAAYDMRPAVQDRVNQFLTGLQSSSQARYVLAVIVSGSASRSEDRWHGGRLVSDIDLMIVTPRTNPMRSRRLSEVMAPFRQLGIDGGPTPLPSLQRFRTLAFYEASATGKVVWGPYQLHELIPTITAADIPCWEVIRVLANRMFEHLKLVCDQTTPELVTSKSYEALAEAALAVEARYRPTYGERLSELIAGRPGLLDLRAHEAAVAALRVRLGLAEKGPKTAPWEALGALLRGLSEALHMYLGSSGSLDQLLAELGKRERHWKHRIYWGATRPGCAASALRTDPVIRLYQAAATVLMRGPSRGEAKALLDAWRACPQIFRYQDEKWARTLRNTNGLVGTRRSTASFTVVDGAGTEGSLT